MVPSPGRPGESPGEFETLALHGPQTSPRNSASLAQEKGALWCGSQWFKSVTQQVCDLEQLPIIFKPKSQMEVSSLPLRVVGRTNDITNAWALAPYKSCHGSPGRRMCAWSTFSSSIFQTFCSFEEDRKQFCSVGASGWWCGKEQCSDMNVVSHCDGPNRA